MRNSVVDVRESLRALPDFLQPLLTWVSGKPHWNQQPLFRSTWRSQTTSALATLTAGTALGFAAIAASSLPAKLLLIPAWLLVAGAARKIQVTLVHQCSHFNFTGNRGWDRTIAQVLSTLVLVDHFDSYFHEHIRIHHTRHLSTAEDPDCRFLLELGFRPGMSTARLWRRLAWTVVSPEFHFRFLRARLRANFVSAPLERRLGAYAYHAVWVGTVAAFHCFPAYCFAWVVPLTVVYHVAALLNFTSLHFWLKTEDPAETGRQRMCSLTAGRFLGDPWPATRLGRLRWFMRFVFMHLPTRVGVLSGDLPVHDYHHRYPRCADWPQFIYMRQRDIEAGTPGWESPYRENWGLFNAIHAVFVTLSESTSRDFAVSVPSPSSVNAPAWAQI